VICHQFERKKIAPMPNFATKEKLRLAQKLLLPQDKKKKHRGHQLYIFDFSISRKKYKRMIKYFRIARFGYICA
jgi:hypothetical protein